MRPQRTRFVGVVEAEAARPTYAATESHVCNPYCGGGRHAELLYRQEPDALTPTLAQAIANLVSPRLLVVDVQAAPEAPLPAGFRTAWLVTYGAQPDGRA
jgi:hypothetical protein